MQFFGVFVPVSAGIRIKIAMQNIDPDHGVMPDAEPALSRAVGTLIGSNDEVVAALNSMPPLTVSAGMSWVCATSAAATRAGGCAI
ncbi:hypothetical protein I3J27_35105 [Bradyrhizobium xenonodulans]|uniref:Uncharacterized protein n=1 Tax=Bradyrhizobium xenonodulans TaxID=2736875 RepID=A0ABY7MIC0_9BRAD|nr:hypothetical protein [Bradyrhizobium xenonodulans]WBL78118.1 hypothetical protein I3J27_35105 [Bradyrhizobium xenonodulans]